jgi:hypothetical protein
MKGDFTKLQSQSKLAEKQYTGVYMQQGRLQLDSDWNTQVEITKRSIQAYVKDLIGGAAGSRGSGVPGKSEDRPVSQEILETGKNFHISPIQNKKDFKIAKGRIYVNSILCELFNELNYTDQEDHPNALEVDLKEEGLQEEAKYIAYLDVWERHLTVLDDPDIGEVALNGLDSTTRTKTVWQVRLIKESEWQDLLKECNEREVSIIATATEIQPKENRLYRIEIHQGGSKKEAKYKWSRDNGSVAFSVTEIKDNVITINSRGRDSSQVLNPGDWVEIIRDDQEKNNQSGTFIKLSTVTTTSSERTKLIIESTLKGESLTPDRYKLSNHLANEDSKVKIKVRRWDFDSTRPDDPLFSTENEMTLDSLIKVSFNDTFHEYQTGDYWLLPVRVNEPIPEWSGEKLVANGIEHHYLRLASSTFDGETFRGDGETYTDEASTVWKDERIAFPSLANCISQQSGLQNLNQLSIGTKEKVATLEVKGPNQEKNPGTKIRSYPEDKTNSIVQLFDSNLSTDDLQVKKLSVGTVITINTHDIGDETTNIKATTIKEVNPEGIFHAYRVDPPLKTKIENPTEYSFEYPIAQFRNSDNVPQVIITPQGKIQAKSLELEPTGEFKTGTFIGNQLQLKGELNGESEQSYGSLQAIDSQLRFTATHESVNFAFLNGDVSISKAGENNRANLTVNGQISANSLVLPPTAEFEAGRFIGQAFLLQQVQSEQPNIPFGEIQIHPLNEDNGQEIRFTAHQGVNFAFLEGNVRIDKSGDIPATLAIKGHVDAASLRLNQETTITEFSNTFELADGQSLETVVPTIKAVNDQLSGKANINGSFEVPFDAEGLRVAGTLQFRERGAAITEFSNTFELADGQSLETVVPTIKAVNDQLSGKANINGSFEVPFDTEGLRVAGTLQFRERGAAITEFSNTFELADGQSLETVVPTISAISTQLESKADIGGNSSQPFQTENLTVRGNLALIADSAAQTQDEILPKLKVQGSAVRNSIQASFTAESIITDERLHVGDTIIVPGATNQLITHQIGNRVYAISPSFFDNHPADQVEVGYYPPITCFTDNGGSEQLTITAQGNVIIGSLRTEFGDAPISLDSKLYVNGKAFAKEIESEHLETAHIRQISSAALKENIVDLSSQEVAEFLQDLRPIKYNYKADQNRTPHAGFLSEEAPDLVTSSSKQTIYPVDILAILTKAVQDQRRATVSLVNAVKKQQQEIIQLRQKIQKLESGGGE